MENQIQHNQRVFDNKISELNELKEDSKTQYVIWDKESNKWLSSEHYCINQNGNVINTFRGGVLCNQEDFEVIFLSEMDKDSMNELVGLAGVAKMIEKKMEDSNVIAFGNKTGRRLFWKYRWTKIYHSFRELVYSSIGQESLKRKLDREIQKLDADIKEWEKLKTTDTSDIAAGFYLQKENRVKE